MQFYPILTQVCKFNQIWLKYASLAKFKPQYGIYVNYVSSTKFGQIEQVQPKYASLANFNLSMQI